MKYLASALRFITLLAISAVAIILLFGEEQHNELTAFIFYFLLHKILGLALIATVCALYTRWAPTDYIISRIHKLCQEE